MERGRHGRHQCHVRGTSAQGWLNTKHYRLPIRKPPKSLTVNWKNSRCKNKSRLYFGTTGFEGLLAGAGSAEACAAVGCARKTSASKRKFEV